MNVKNVKVGSRQAKSEAFRFKRGLNGPSSEFAKWVRESRKTSEIMEAMKTPKPFWGNVNRKHEWLAHSERALLAARYAMDKEKIFDDATRKFVFEATRDYCKTRIEEIHEKNPKIQHFLNESAMEIEKILSEKLGEDWEKFRKAYCAFLSIFEGIQENMPKAKKFGLLEELLGKAKFHA